MSLIDEFTNEYILMEKTRISDGEGGFITTWTEGITVNLAERHDNTTLSTNKGKIALESVYTFVCDKAMRFNLNDYIKRASDGSIFRVTKPSGENITPSSSSLNLTYFEAEKGELPT